MRAYSFFKSSSLPPITPIESLPLSICSCSNSISLFMVAIISSRTLIFLLSVISSVRVISLFLVVLLSCLVSEASSCCSFFFFSSSSFLFSFCAKRRTGIQTSTMMQTILFIIAYAVIFGKNDKWCFFRSFEIYFFVLQINFYCFLGRYYILYMSRKHDRIDLLKFAIKRIENTVVYKIFYTYPVNMIVFRVEPDELGVVLALYG